VDEALTRLVRDRAGGRCEYCHLPATQFTGVFELEHIIARQHHGTTTPSNLAYACLACNKSKGPNLTGIDYPRSRTRIARLFHPRRHRWAYHFRWEGAVLVGLTPIGRATTDVLDINDPDRIGVRDDLMREGGFPFE
jgi:hypothetical protein